MTTTLVCWKCGAPLVDQPVPVARVAECSACRADLHVCRMCEFYDTRVAMSCREPVADQVRDKERANFCAYFAVKPDAYRARDETISPAVRAQLDALFGADNDGTIVNNAKAVSRSEADIAREQLEQLFGSGKKGDI